MTEDDPKLNEDDYSHLQVLVDGPLAPAWRRFCRIQHSQWLDETDQASLTRFVQWLNTGLDDDAWS